MVHSDTLGLVRFKSGGFMVADASQNWKAFTQLMTRWLKDNTPPELLAGSAAFPCTSISVNKNYAGKLHRDGGNAGPSVLMALGDFTGGGLNYHARDGCNRALDTLTLDGVVKADPKSNVTLFDGRRAHEVADFQGERYSLVFFTQGAVKDLKANDRKELETYGFNVPNKV